MEPENEGVQKESPFPGADFQVPGKLEARGVNCISLVSPGISSDFICRNHLSCPIIAKATSRFHVVGDRLWKPTILYTSPQNQEIPSKRDHPKSNLNLPILDFDGLSNRCSGVLVASLPTFWILLGSQGLSPVYAFVNSNPPGSALRCHKGVEKQPRGKRKNRSAFGLTYPLRTGSSFFCWDVWTCGYRKQKQPGVSGMPQNGAMPLVAVGTMILWLYIWVVVSIYLFFHPTT